MCAPWAVLFLWFCGVSSSLVLGGAVLFYCSVMCCELFMCAPWAVLFLWFCGVSFSLVLGGALLFYCSVMCCELFMCSVVLL